jgi:hypothetical protein
LRRAVLIRLQKSKIIPYNTLRLLLAKLIEYLGNFVLKSMKTLSIITTWGPVSLPLLKTWEEPWTCHASNRKTTRILKKIEDFSIAPLPLQTKNVLHLRWKVA